MSLPFNPDTSAQIPAENNFTSSTDKTNLNDWTKIGINLYNSALGNVAIGTTSTIYKLNVNGSINFVTLYENGNLIDFTTYATKSLLSSGLATKQDKINAYVLQTGSVGSLGFLAGTLTLVLPNNYSSLTATNLTASTSFTYKNVELSTTLNNYTPFSALQQSNFVNFPQLSSALALSNYVGFPQLLSCNYTPFSALQQSNYVNFPQLLSCNYTPFNALQQSNYTPFSALQQSNYTPFLALQQSNYVNFPQLLSCNYITNATSSLNNYPSYSAIGLSNFVNFPQLLSCNFVNFPQLSSCNYITNSTSGLVNYTRTGLDPAYLLKSGGAMTGQITGVTTLNGTTGIFGTLATTNNTNTGTPETGVNGAVNGGDKIILYAGGVGAHPYSIGIAPNNLWYSATAGASHNFYIGGGNPKMTISSSGNVAIGTINNISSKLTINDIVIDRWLYDHSTSPLTITNQTPTGTTLNDSLPILNLCRQGVNAVAFGARATFKLCRYENVDINSKTRMDISLAHTNYQTETNVMTLRSDGNVGIGKTNPTQILQVGNAGRLRISNGTDDYSILGTIDNDGPLNTRIVVSGNTRGNTGHIEYVATSGGSHIFYTTNSTTERMRIDTNGNVSLTGNLSVQSQLIYNYLFNNTGGIHGDIANFDNVSHFGYKFINGLTNGPAGFTYPSYYSWFIGLGSNYPATGANSYGCQFAVPRNTTNPYLFVRYKENNVWGSWYSTRALTAQKATELEVGDQWIFGNLYVTEYLTCKLFSVDYVGYDDVGVLDATGTGQNNSKTLRQIWNSFTAFHRCFADDELFNPDNPQEFKDDYMGRIVVSTGTIKTHSSKINENGEVEWEIKTGKEAIIIEDAHSTIELSRKKKDKRVLGVLGLNTRNNSSPERMIINSIGEGAVWVCNFNGNFENGDYIQSSDYLGYGERQDDDILHNYTLGKITMDCDFQLDSELYQCKEIEEYNENGEKLRVAFVACVYFCG